MNSQSMNPGAQKKLGLHDRDIHLTPTSQEIVEEKWSAKYKKSIDCNNPKGFSQRAGRGKRQAHQPTKSKAVK